MRGDDGVDHAAESFAREHGVFFDEFGEVVEPGGDGEGEEEEAEEEAGVALLGIVSEGVDSGREDGCLREVVVPTSCCGYRYIKVLSDYSMLSYVSRRSICFPQHSLPCLTPGSSRHLAGGSNPILILSRK